MRTCRRVPPQIDRFRAHHRPAVKAANPGLNGPELNAILNDMWTRQRRLGSPAPANPRARRPPPPKHTPQAIPHPLPHPLPHSPAPANPRARCGATPKHTLHVISLTARAHATPRAHNSAGRPPAALSAPPFFRPPRLPQAGKHEVGRVRAFRPSELAPATATACSLDRTPQPQRLSVCGPPASSTPPRRGPKGGLPASWKTQAPPTHATSAGSVP